MGSEHEHLLLHRKERWLSRGNVLNRLIEMKEEVSMFLDQHPSLVKDVIFEFKDRFPDVIWLIKVTYLCDIFDFLNNLNLKLRGSNVTVIKVQEKVEASTKILSLWARLVEAGNCKVFTKLTELQKEFNVSAMPDEISAAIKEHLLGLETSLKEYFPPINSNKAWIRNPFTVNVESETELQDSDINFLIELSCDTALKNMFDRLPLMDFWLSCRQEYPCIAEKAIKFLMPFVTTYKCKAGFRHWFS